MTNDIIVGMIKDIREREKRMGDLIRELTTAKRTEDASSLAAVFSAYKPYEVGVISKLFDAQVAKHQKITGDAMRDAAHLIHELEREDNHD